MKKVLLFIIMILIFPCLVNAKSKTSCNYTLLSNLKKLTNNVNISYSYRNVDDYVVFDVTLTNIQPDMYFVDQYNDTTYYYNNTDNGTITLSNYYSGKIKYYFYSNNSECLNEKLGVKVVSLPYYNKYYNHELCQGIEEYNLCQRWIKYNGDYDDFLYATNNYKVSLLNNEEEVLGYTDESFFTKIVKYFTSYYYIILPLLIIIIVGIMYLVKYIKNKKNRFDI